MTETTLSAPARAIRRRAEGGVVRKTIRGVGWVSLWLGLLTLGFVVHQLWITTWLAERNQSDLAAERIEHFESVEITEVAVTPEGVVLAPDVRPGDPVAGTEVFAVDVPLKVEAPPDAGEAFALIRVPKLERLQEGWNVVEGVSVSDLKNGAGHMPWTPLPGQPGNSVISGHRTTYGAPFHEFDELELGDVIEVETALGVHVYEVRESVVVTASDVWVTEHRDGAWLTLTTCHPRFSSRQRLVVVAELVRGPNAEVIGAFR